MVFPHQFPPGEPCLLITRLAAQAQHLIGVFTLGFRRGAAGAISGATIATAPLRAFPGRGIEGEARVDAAQHIAFGFCHRPISARNLHQRHQHIFQHGLVVSKGFAELVREGFPPFSAFARLIEQPPDFAQSFFWHMEMPAKGGNFLSLDRPVHLCEFGGKDNDGEGKQILLTAQKGHKVRRGRGKRTGFTA